MRKVRKDRLLWVILLAFVLAACTQSLSESVHFADAPRDYEVRATPLDGKSRFLIELISHSSRDLCISVDDWPNTLGEVSGGGERATVIADGKALSAADTNFGYCVGEACTLRIKPGHTLKGMIGYKEFGEPLEIGALSSKRLEYHVRPYVCPIRK